MTNVGRMTRAFWIWKDRLPEIIRSIADKAGVNPDHITPDQILYGLTGTSDEKDYWLNCELGSIGIRFAYDADDIGIIHIQVKGLNADEIGKLSIYGTEIGD